MGMLSGFDKWGGRGSTVVTFWPLLSAGAVAAVSALLSRQVDWINQFGAFGWFSAAVVTFLAVAAALNLAASVWQKMQMADATKRWAKAVEGINPLDSHFDGKRIKIADLSHPAKLTIEQKTFRNCQLVGPNCIAFMGHGSVTNCSFYGCDLVLMKDHCFVQNGVAFQDCHIDRTEFIKCTLLINRAMLPAFKALGAQFVTATGDAEFDNRLPPSIGQGRPL